MELLQALLGEAEHRQRVRWYPPREFRNRGYVGDEWRGTVVCTGATRDLQFLSIFTTARLQQ